MKIKGSFVTNSSSSSFVAFVVDRSLIEDKVSPEKKLKKFYEYVENCKESMYRKELYKKLISMKTDEERFEWMEDNFDKESLYDDLVPGFGYHSGEYENDYFGIEIGTIMSKYPDLKIGYLAKELAMIVNNELGTEIEEFDYVEESGYNG